MWTLQETNSCPQSSGYTLDLAQGPDLFARTPLLTPSQVESLRDIYGLPLFCLHVYHPTLT